MSEKYKFKSLKIYTDVEWLYDGNKRYRKVFEADKTSYIYVELCLHNKRFDEEDWDLNFSFKCFKSDGTSLCDLPFTHKVNKENALFYAREGWGNKEKGAFWKKGMYYWEAWIEGQLVATEYFYVEQTPGSAQYPANPFLEVSSIRLYEGSYEGSTKENRIYLSHFDQETRYVFIEVMCKNLNKDVAWYCEAFAFFFTEGRDVKGRVNSFQLVRAGQETIEITAGWGSSVTGSWKLGKYHCDLQFFDQFIGRISFEIKASAELLETTSLARFLQHGKNNPAEEEENGPLPDASLASVELPIGRPGLITPLCQFILFFIDYIKLITGNSINIITKRNTKGLLLLVQKGEAFRLVEEHLKHYVGFVLKGEIGEIKPLQDVSQRELDIIKMQIDQQLFHLEMGFKFEQMRDNKGTGDDAFDPDEARRELLAMLLQAVEEARLLT